MNDLAVLLIPVRGPLPDVARHVVKSVTVRWKGSHRRRAFKPIRLQILPRKLSLPRVRHMFSARSKFIAPDKYSTFHSPACSELPLGFRRQLFLNPFCISLSIFVRDMNYGMLGAPF